MPTNCILTTAGKNFAINAFNSGILIAIKYCVPVYDYRLDSNIHNQDPTFGTVSIPYSDTIAATSAATYPTGERIWFGTNYNISNNLILSGSSTISVSGAYTKVTGCPQSVVGLGANLSGNTPLSNSISASTFYPPSLTNYWLINTATSARIAGVNATTYTDRSKYWGVGDYFPTVDSNGNVVGSFRAHLNQSVGRFKFNKIAFYAVSVDANGNENLGVAPTFFGECFVSELAVKSNVEGEGFDDFIIDAQIDLSTFNSYGTSGFFSTSGDYWVRTVGGLYSPDPIGVGSFAGGVTTPQASVHVRYVESNQRRENLLRLDASGSAGETKYVLGDIRSNGNMVLSASTTGRSLSANMSLDPILNNTYNLGTSAHKYATAYIDDIKSTSFTTEFIYNTIGTIQVYTGLEIMEDKIIETNAILPNYDDLYNIGSNDLRYANAYIQQVTCTNVNCLGTVQIQEILDTPSIYNSQSPAIAFASDINMDGQNIESSHIYPIDDITYNLGKPDFRYLNGYIDNLSANKIDVTDTITAAYLVAIENIDAPSIYNSQGSTVAMASDLSMDGQNFYSNDIIPISDNQFDIGQPALWYANGYINNLSASTIGNLNNALITVTSNFIPNGARDLGDGINMWYRMYATNAYINNIYSSSIDTFSISADNAYLGNIYATDITTSNLIKSATVSATSLLAPTITSTGLTKSATVSATNITADSITSRIKVGEGSANPNTHFKILLISGTIGTGNQNIGLDGTGVLSGNLLNYNVLLQSEDDLGFYPPGVPDVPHSYDIRYVASANNIYLFNRNAQIDGAVMSRITVMYAT